MRFLRSIVSTAVLILCGTDPCNAKAPASPSGLKVEALGVNSFLLQWEDNSKNETGWEIRIALSGAAPQRFVLVPSPNVTSYTVITNDLPGERLFFQMTAYNVTAGKETLSKPTPIVSVKALSSKPFEAPTKLRAKALDDGRITLTWVDNAHSETGYQIESRIGSGKWQTFLATNPGIKFKVGASGFAPSEKRSFRVRAIKAPATVSAWSNVAKVTLKSLRPPSALVATPEGEGSFSLKWKDNSFSESGIEIESKTGDGPFLSLGRITTPNITSATAISGFDLDTDHQFRIRAYRTVGTATTFSAYSVVASKRSTPMKAPTALTVTTTTADSITLAWKDESVREFAYEISAVETGTGDILSASAGQNSQTAKLSGLKPGTQYEIRVRASDFFSGFRSAYTSVVTARTREGILGTFNPLIVTGSQFLYKIQLTRPDLVTTLTVTGLPAGLIFNPTSRTITGSVASGGPFTATLTATFNDGSTTTRSLFLKLTAPAPAIISPFAGVNVAVASNGVVSLAGKFSDPDTTSAARVTTTLGVFDIVFFPSEAPATVDNFLDYTDLNAFDSSFFHRAPPNFVVQGGGFRHTSAAGYSRIAVFPPVINEPGLSNLRGTVAMAKQPGNPNSATSQWFVNVNNNSANLDGQNGGFTVFGRVPNSGMAVVDAISALPRNTYTIPIGAGEDTLDDVPVNTAPPAPAVLDPAQLVKISSVTAAPILSYTVLSANTAIATANLSGTEITITGVAAGSTTVAVKATDLDGNMTSQNIAVTVP